LVKYFEINFESLSMSLRTAPRAVAKHTPHARAAQDPSQNLTGALAVLDSLRRDRLLEAVALAARELLRTSDLAKALPKVIEQIGQATGVNRAHLFLVDAASADGRILQHHVWTAAQIATPPEFLNAKAPMAEIGLGSWIATLKRGEIITGHVHNLDPVARGFFERGGVKSVLCVPVFADSAWLGMIAFDDCNSEHDWSVIEIDTVKTLAEMVGAAVTRTVRMQQLADANRIIENSPTILYRVGPHYPFPLIFLSENVSRYGYHAGELLAHPERWPQLIETADLPGVLADTRALSEGKIDTVNAEFRIRKADGSIVCFDSRGSAVRDADNRIVAIEGILTDVTDRKNSENELSFSQILLASAIENSPDAILVVDVNGRIIVFNRHFVELWAIPSELVNAGVDEAVLKIVSSRIKNENEFVAHVRHLYSHPEIQSHEELETKDGRIIERHSGSLYDKKSQYLGRIWYFRDITDTKRAADKIAALARTDALTGLPNRAAFLDRLNLEFARAKRGANQFAVHYLDLDHFKDVNDTLGHPMGDKLLQAVADRLKACVRETDMVARFGGDEFAILQDDISDSGSVEALAAKIGEVIAAPFAIEDSQVQTTASIGIVPFRGDVTGVDAMMMKADLALYRAKNDGRNQFRFHVAELDEQTRERMIIGEELRHAIKRDEFELYYQPQVELKSGRIVGMEALIRWNHPKRGLMLPTTFIPIAETTGSIVPIGEWVIEHACRQVGAWNDLGIAPSTVAVNLSGAQFKLASQLDRIVTECLARYHIAPEQLELELTESVLLQTTQRHSDVFNRLRKIGVRLAIDDFGTGYSSLDYLRLFRVSRLKIDQRFIRDVATSADDAAIVRATIGLAHELGMEVVAEGVETAGQRDFLIAAACKLAQGYYFGKPVPVAAASEMLTRKVLFAAT
jgi:diguanylate cyclase (GGDEF)-like protein/PAS domain S-box-containing protein